MGAEVDVSLVATTLTAFCWIPQLLRAFRTTDGLSVSSWLQSVVLGGLWGPTGWSPARGCWWPAKVRSLSGA